MKLEKITQEEFDELCILQKKIVDEICEAGACVVFQKEGFDIPIMPGSIHSIHTYAGAKNSAFTFFTVKFNKGVVCVKPIMVVVFSYKNMMDKIHAIVHERGHVMTAHLVPFEDNWIDQSKCEDLAINNSLDYLRENLKESTFNKMIEYAHNWLGRQIRPYANFIAIDRILRENESRIT
jgi:hypothetical protein